MRIPFITIIILFLFSFGCDAYILSVIKRNTAPRSKWNKIYLWSAVICWLYLVVMLCLPRRNADSNILCVMWMMYAYLSIYFPKFIFVIFSLIGRLPNLWKKKSWKSGLYVGLPLGILTFIVMWWGASAGRTRINVERVELSMNRLPESFDGLRIVQFSDLHTGSWGNDTTFVSNIVDSINSLNPDMILFTGDIVNRQTKELEPFLPVLGRLKAPLGIYSVFGNHDYGDYVDWNHESERQVNNSLLAAWERQMGWKVLDNKHDFVVSNAGDSIVIIGVDNWGEPPFPQYGDLNKAYPKSSESSFNQNDDKFKILLSHNPEHWNREVSHDTNIDLTLGGHTHAMQMMLKIGNWKWSPSKYRYDQWGGLYDRLNDNGEKTTLYVNIGSGEVGIPARVGADSEITLFTLRSARK